jgi:hypothetical protein
MRFTLEKYLHKFLAGLKSIAKQHPMPERDPDLLGALFEGGKTRQSKYSAGDLVDDIIFIKLNLSSDRGRAAGEMRNLQNEYTTIRCA